MSDVNDTQAIGAQAPAVEADTTQVAPQQPEQTAAPQPAAPQTPQERMIPYSRFQEVNNGYKEMQRKLAEIESRSKLSQYTEEDMNAVLSHPYVQELLISQAKRELTDYASELLDQHPEVPEAVKKAIKANVRGFVKETTTDVESGKIDIQEYIESLVESLGPQAAPAPKSITVAATSAPEAVTAARPMDVQKIMEKPMDEWTEDDAKLVDQYKKSMPTNGR
jgi:hypothetical protein